MNNLLWKPSDSRIKNSALTAFMKALNAEHSLSLQDYSSLHQFSVAHKDLFWKSLITFFGVKFKGSLDPVLLEEGFEN